MTQDIVSSCGDIQYILTRKRIKNINLRIKHDGSVNVSAPYSASALRIDQFVASKAEWINRTRRQMLNKTEKPLCRLSDEECLNIAMPIAQKVFLAFNDILNGLFPKIYIKDMKSRWGVCYTVKRQINLSRQLFAQPQAAIEYVILHEFCHFVYADHQKGFHSLMAQLMLDYKQRRRLLK